MPVLLFLWELSSGMQIWNIVLICVFYCLKIIPGWGTTFLLLKRNFSSVAVTILLVGFTFTLATCFIDTYRETPLNGTLRFHNGTCSHIELPDRLIPARLSIIYLMYTIVLTLVISSCWAVVAHLRSHMKRMRGNQSEVGGAKQEGIARVALMIFLLAVEFVVCTIVRHTLLVLSGDKISRYLIQDNSLIALMLSSLIPITLITGINTLRQRATTCFSSTSQNV
ncbi:hypothetical protein AAFF_G00197600 [Aldrovandia affinis]|uniref:Taste receptor type 2 n=1 Tax=Aldrovandia affinis TaxID=143900 RepID=A0AAD7RIR6_9TELE|nr:hypothetical protein AAFF_G00197600 [Aldrovandia affinis]